MGGGVLYEKKVGEIRQLFIGQVTELTGYLFLLQNNNQVILLKRFNNFI